MINFVNLIMTDFTVFLKNNNLNNNTKEYIFDILKNDNLRDLDKYEILEELLNDIKQINKWKKIKNNFDGC